MPNLIEVQRESYEQFLRSDKSTGYVSGLEKTLRSVFPIRDFAGTAELDFVHYELEDPKYDTTECRQRGITYAAPMKVTLRLIVFEVDQETETRSVLDIKEQDVYMGDMPLMTENGTFIINGTERVIVSQMHRSPGVLFDHDRGKTHSSGKFLFAARVIPYRGSWLDFEFDAKDIVNVRIDRKRKLPVTALLYALGSMTSRCSTTSTQGHWKRSSARPAKAGRSRSSPSSGAAPSRLRAGRRQDRRGSVPGQPEGLPRAANKAAKDGLKTLLIPTEEVFGRYSARDLIDESTGRIYIEAGEEVSPDNLEKIDKAGIDRLELLDIDHVSTGPWIRNTMQADKAENREEGLEAIYKVMRPGEPPTQGDRRGAVRRPVLRRRALRPVGGRPRQAQHAPRPRRRGHRDHAAQGRHPRGGQGAGRPQGRQGRVDDIDHLGNRRVRSVGELLENQYRVGLLRMERAVKERMSSVDVSTVMPHDLINAKPAAARCASSSARRSSASSWTRPIRCPRVTHKRRVSALGPGGLTRERAGFEVRDVHPTHYGRICPIETPEGPNIGLINSLSTYARVNKYGFVETPYRKVKDGRVTDEVVYLSAMEEGRYTVAQANIPIDNRGRFTEDMIVCRHAGDVQMVPADKVDFMDVSPKQLVSVAAALIPFLENDDANRALMGSNMQRQAVPLVRAEAPFVGTGMEGRGCA
jgi:DNA-directed RNA polymerase subunit beta